MTAELSVLHPGKAKSAVNCLPSGRKNNNSWGQDVSKAEGLQVWCSDASGVFKGTKYG